MGLFMLFFGVFFDASDAVLHAASQLVQFRNFLESESRIESFSDTCTESFWNCRTVWKSSFRSHLSLSNLLFNQVSASQLWATAIAGAAPEGSTALRSSHGSLEICFIEKTFVEVLQV